MAGLLTGIGDLGGRAAFPSCGGVAREARRGGLFGAAQRQNEGTKKTRRV
jgi:hypothetical protein